MAEEEKKQKRATCKKRHLQDERKRVQSKAHRSRMKTAYKTFLTSLKNEDAKKRIDAYAELSSILDKGVNKGIFKKNKSSRLKARMSARLKAQAAA